MSEEKKDGCCGTSGSGGSSCCAGKKFVVGLVVGALLFAAGMWFAKAQCHKGAGGMCPMSGTMQK